MPEKQYCMYIMTNQRNTVFYTGVSSALPARVTAHKHKIVSGFTKRYNIDKLVYYEVYETAYDAIAREKQVKKWRREKKLWLIKRKNPNLKDLSDEL